MPQCGLLRRRAGGPWSMRHGCGQVSPDKHRCARFAAECAVTGGRGGRGRLRGTWRELAAAPAGFSTCACSVHRGDWCEGSNQHATTIFDAQLNSTQLNLTSQNAESPQ
eukprot:1096520-Prymnesium_polylepis.2